VRGALGHRPDHPLRQRGLPVPDRGRGAWLPPRGLGGPARARSHGPLHPLRDRGGGRGGARRATGGERGDRRSGGCRAGRRHRRAPRHRAEPQRPHRGRRAEGLALLHPGRDREPRPGPDRHSPRRARCQHDDHHGLRLGRARDRRGVRDDPERPAGRGRDGRCRGSHHAHGGGGLRRDARPRPLGRPAGGGVAALRRAPLGVRPRRGRRTSRSPHPTGAGRSGRSAPPSRRPGSSRTPCST